MKISLVTPAGKKSRSGNRTTAVRWGRILKSLGHKVKISEEDDGVGADVMIAVHAWRSHKSIKAFSVKYPKHPLIVLLSGTDIYSFQHSHPKETLDSMQNATALVCLHDLVGDAIPKKYTKKLTTIYQSAKPLPFPKRPSKKTFDICVIGHLRDEKDPLRAAYATKFIQPNSKIRIIHLGKAHDKKWLHAVQKEQRHNPRFFSLGDVPSWRVRRQLCTSKAMVISSIMEGGANVVSEAIMAGIPIIASKIDGNIGLLGADYGGYFCTRNTEALACLLDKMEQDPRFLKRLTVQIIKRQGFFKQSRETQAWQALLKKITVSR